MSETDKSITSASDGMTLIELALVLTIVGILIGSAVPMAKTFFQNRIRNRIEGRLDDARQVLLTYWKARFVLPCPDSDGDGHADCGWGGGTRLVGTLPYADLGIPPDDGSGRPIYYVVVTQLTDHQSVTDLMKSQRCELLQSLTPGILAVNDKGNIIAVSAVIISGGISNKDGEGGFLDGENADGDDGLYERKPPDDQFDDQLIYLGPYSLISSGCGQLVVQNQAGASLHTTLRVDQSFDGGSSWLVGISSIQDGSSSPILRVESGSWIRVVREDTGGVLDQFIAGPTFLFLSYEDETPSQGPFPPVFPKPPGPPKWR